MAAINSTSLLDSALARHQAGDLGEATRLYREVLASEPHHPDALHMMGVIAKQKGNNDLALKLIEAALGQRTAMPLAWNNRALILRALGRKDEALQSAEQAVDLDPTLAEAWDMIGFLRCNRRDFDGARVAHAHAVRLRPEQPNFLANHALLLLGTGELQQAYDTMRKVGQRDPTLLPQTMGNILKAAGYPGRALPYYRKSREMFPDNDDVRVTEAMAHLLVGDFREGWALWETRASLDPHFQPMPFWDGGAVDHLLLHEDQGFGDAFQCARYIPNLHRFSKRITIQISRAVHRIFVATFPDCEVLTLDDPVPAANARIRLLSLPAFFGASDTNIPAPTPYLRVEKEWRHKWQGGLADIPRPRIGMVWGGNPEHLNDRLRSAAFKDMAPLLQAGKKHLISLQKGAQKNAAELTAAGIFDADPFLGDFADTAGLMTELDLLITVDTSVAHLAGALGKPVWLLLPFDPDWRWLLGREDTPWYPTMRLFRQQKPGDWAGVLQRVTADLNKFLSGDGSVLQPAQWNGGCLARKSVGGLLGN